jgi:hypothetical protein
VSYPPKGINKFTPVNLRLPGSNRLGGIFLLAASFQQVHPQQPPGCCAAPVPG